LAFLQIRISKRQTKKERANRFGQFKFPMKFFAFFICFYFTALTAIPTVRGVKEHFAKNCPKTNSENTSKNSLDYPGCHKEKCLLNVTFNSSIFLVFNQNYAIKPLYSSVRKLEKTFYHKNFTSYYSASIWQPPRPLFLVP
jgi:hypothetical protein